MVVINVSFSICSLLFLIIIMSFYFYKPRIKSLQNQIYTIIIVSNMIGLILDIVGFALFNIQGVSNNIRLISSRAYMFYYIFFIFLLAIYTYVICRKNNKHINSHNIFLFLTIITIINIIMTITLPMSLVIDGTTQYSSGPLVTYIYSLTGLIMVAILYMIVKNYKTANKSEMLPIFFFLISGIVVVIIQLFFPMISLSLTMEVVVTILMYFTIENPDVKMLEEFKIAKDIALKANEEKEVFLYNITQNIKLPLNNIRNASEWLNENSKSQNTKDASYYINKNAFNVINMVNEVLDISSIEVNKIKVYKNKYDINNIAMFIKKRFIGQVPEKVDFRINIDSNIPKLYGDQIRVKQVLEILVDNAIKNTKAGFVELSVNSITKNNICRLIINIEDSGYGILPSEINKILDKNNLYYDDNFNDDKSTIALSKSIIGVLGGILLIDSEIGRGTKITIVLDQKIYDAKSEGLYKIEKEVEKYASNKKVLIVIEDEEYREKFLKKITKYDLDIEIAELGSKCIDNIRLSKKYDLIIMDEKLTHLSCLDIMTKLIKIPSFNIPVALLTDNTDNDGYLDHGFKYLLDKKNISKELDKIINKIRDSK